MEAELLTPADFLPQSSSALKDFYRYEGSLTTPMCNEVVVWTVFEGPVEVSSDQVRCWRVLICIILNQLKIFTSSSRYSHNFFHTGNSFLVVGEVQTAQVHERRSVGSDG